MIDRDNLPKQIASAKLRIGAVEIEVVQLDNGMRLITEESTQQLFDSNLMSVFLDVQKTHELSTEPQSIADQILAKCSCGWSHPVSTIDFDTGEKIVAELTQRHLDHMAEDQRSA